MVEVVRNLDEAASGVTQDLLTEYFGTATCKQRETLHGLLRAGSRLTHEEVTDASLLPARLQHMRFDDFFKGKLISFTYNKNRFALNVAVDSKHSVALPLLELGWAANTTLNGSHFEWKLDDPEYVNSAPEYELQHLIKIRELSFLHPGLSLRSGLGLLEPDRTVAQVFKIAAIVSQAHEAAPNIFTATMGKRTHLFLVSGNENTPNLSQGSEQSKLDFIFEHLPQCLDSLGHRIKNPVIAFAALAERAGLGYLNPDSNSFFIFKSPAGLSEGELNAIKISWDFRTNGGYTLHRIELDGIL